MDLGDQVRQRSVGEGEWSTDHVCHVADAGLEAEVSSRGSAREFWGAGAGINKPEGRCEHREIPVTARLTAGCSGLEPRYPVGFRCPTPSHEPEAALAPMAPSLNRRTSPECGIAGGIKSTRSLRYAAPGCARLTRPRTKSPRRRAIGSHLGDAGVLVCKPATRLTGLEARVLMGGDLNEGEAPRSWDGGRKLVRKEARLVLWETGERKKVGR